MPKERVVHSYNPICCEHCGSQFIPTRPWQIYCQKKCKLEARHARRGFWISGARLDATIQRLADKFARDLKTAILEEVERGKGEVANRYASQRTSQRTNQPTSQRASPVPGSVPQPKS